MKLTISLAQIQVQLGRPEANFANLQSIAGEAARRESHILLLPELWSTGYALADAGPLAKVNQEMLPEISRLAGEHALAIGGSLLLEKEGGIYNTFSMHLPGSSSSILYEKIHLFRLMEEDRWLSPGGRLVQFNAPWGSTGLAICYDLRFPEMFRRYALDGARIVLISAEWPLQRIRHWQTLLRARAIENQCFFAAVNCVGPCGSETFGGLSAVISPWGDVLSECSADQQELITVTIDMEEVARIRQQIPIFEDRRSDLYG